METPTKLPPMPSKVSEAELDPKRRYVQIGKGDTYWMEMTYHAALHTVTLERLKAKADRADSPRKLLRQLRGMKNENEFEITHDEAIRRVVKVEKAMTLAEVEKKGGVVVAAFPDPDEAEDPTLDKRIGST